MCVMHTCANACRNQKRISGQLELQAVVTQTQVLLKDPDKP